MRKYNLLNNTIGWVVFAIALATYMLTLEPTASFWDCPEFISQGYKNEIGHPPGNPIFMLAARFAINFASDAQHAALAVNAMSGILSALTILLLFWTITHLVKRLVVAEGEEEAMSLTQYFVIFGSGITGALAYTWSDTFWFSAVEAEVYAFSSFCTALVFWLILKWENRADEVSSDRYLILIAYVIGVSIAVHLLNLLCIPAIVLVFYYKKFKNTNVKGSLIALCVSFVIIALILYGLVPGIVEAAQLFELLCVNTLGMPFNSGAIIYVVIALSVASWCLYELYTQRNATRIKISFFLAVLLSGMLFIGDGWTIAFVLTLCFAVYLYKFCTKIPVRVFAITAMSVFVIFVGYSSYSLIIIRSSANTPINQNSPDNLFSLSSYLNREQYGDRPLIYGQTFNAGIVYQANENGSYRAVAKEGKALYAKQLKQDPNEKDHYFMKGHDQKYVTNPEMDMLFPRMYDGKHAREYREWINMQGTQVEATTHIDRDGNTTETEIKIKPTFIENLRFFLDYQLNYMYWRYFMWNFVGRQNDIQGSGEITHGNWISGIPFIDNLRLGDQSLLPADLGSGNKGHNVFFMLPLILGIIGLLWQAYAGKKGIEQFWVIFFLFFMTGIAIVIYLNQTPSQPRERDYAYAGSFYAFAIWIGMGVAGLWKLILTALALTNKQLRTKYAGNTALAIENFAPKHKLTAAIIATVLGVLVPLQMVSQTWDDHDRSGRYAARDFGMNYLSSLDPNAIIFTNGDNDTFPLWYCQEVEGYRTDVRVVNLSYLTTDWYIAQMRYKAYDSDPLPMLASHDTFAYDRRQFNYFIDPDTTMRVPVLKSLAQLYGPDFEKNPYNLPELKYPNMYIPIDADVAIREGRVSADKRDAIVDYISCNLLEEGTRTARDGAINSSATMTLDIIASSIAQGWKRPIYFARTVPESYYLTFTPYLQSTGLALEVTPIQEFGVDGENISRTDRAYENVTTKFRWGGIDVATPESIYLDETVRRMVTTHRDCMNNLAYTLVVEGFRAQEKAKSSKDAAEIERLNKFATDRFNKARKVLDLMDEKLPTSISPYSVTMGLHIANTRSVLADLSGNKTDKEKVVKLLENEVLRYVEYVKYYQSLPDDLYRRLDYNDHYIDQRYLPDLIQAYVRASEKNGQAFLERLNKLGLNLDRVLHFLKAQSQSAAPAQEEAVADTTAM